MNALWTCTRIGQSIPIYVGDHHAYTETIPKCLLNSKLLRFLWLQMIARPSGFNEPIGLQ